MSRKTKCSLEEKLKGIKEYSFFNNKSIEKESIH